MSLTFLLLAFVIHQIYIPPPNGDALPGANYFSIHNQFGDECQRFRLPSQGRMLWNSHINAYHNCDYSFGDDLIFIGPFSLKLFPQDFYILPRNKNDSYRAKMKHSYEFEWTTSHLMRNASFVWLFIADPKRLATKFLNLRYVQCSPRPN